MTTQEPGTPAEGAVADPASPAPASAAPVAPEPAAAPPATPAASEEKTVDAPRFNKLMSDYQKVLAEKTALEREQMSDTERLQSERDEAVARAQELEGLVAQGEIESAKARALTQYPEVAPFAEMLYAESPEGVMELAAELSAKVKELRGETPAAPTQPVPASPAAPAPVLPSAPGATTTPVDAVAAAITKGDWSAYLEAKFRQQQMAEQQS